MIFLSAEACPIVTLLLLLSISNNFSVVVSIKCYSCNSRVTGQSGCKDTSDDYVIECPTDAVACRKIWLFMDLDGSKTDHSESIIRQCSMTTWEIGCKKVFGTNGQRIKEEICECNVDKCNMASRFKSFSGYVMLLMVFISLLNFIA